MLVRLKALWAAISYRVLTTKDWLSAKSFSITGLHAAYVVAACLVALGLAYHLGKWDGSPRGLQKLAVGFMIPAADPPKAEVSTVETAQPSENLVGELAQCQAELADAQTKGQQAAKAASAPPPPVAPAATPVKSDCKPVVRYYRPRETTVLQDIGSAIGVK